jgi:KDO2-lipid IV(A) lauroyltransferase
MVKYREKVIEQNLQNSFPEWSNAERQKVKREYYQHLAELAAEMIKMLTMSRKNVMRRYRCINPECVNACFDKKQNVILMSSHYNNWEWMVLSLAMQFRHRGVGVGAPNSNKVFEKLINRVRTRYGTEVIFASFIRDDFQKSVSGEQLTAYMMLGDQSPANLHRSYVTTFLHQPTAVIFGGEYYAKKYNFPVFYYRVRKRKRGFYEIELQLVTEFPNTLPHGAITEQYIALLEKTIREQPAFWLWSHKRWKHNLQKAQ